MTTQATRNTVTGWRRKFAGGLISAALAAGLALGAGPAPARADVLDDLAQEFSVGSGAGQVANLLKATLKLRAQGYRPSRANLDEITKALSYRPNQKPLIEALGDTLSYQQKIRAQSSILTAGQNANSAVMGAGQMPADSRPVQAAPPPAPATGQDAPPPLFP